MKWLIFIAMLCATIPAQADVTNGLIAWWKLDEASGNAIDATGNGYTGTETNTSVSSSCPKGSCRVFNGSNSFIAINNRPLDNLVAGTVSLFINHSSFNGGIPIYEEGNGFNNFAIVTPANGSSTMNFNIGSNTNRPSTKSSWTTNTWYHIAITWDSDIRIYVNGALDNTIAAVVSTAFGVSRANDQLGRYLFFSGSNGLYLDGLLDDVRYYNRALTSAEINEVYMSAVKRFRLNGRANLNGLKIK